MQNLKVTEYADFNSAWNKAIRTQEKFGWYAEQPYKMQLLKEKKQFFVDENNELWTIGICTDGLRNVKIADPVSCLSSGKFKSVYIQDGEFRFGKPLYTREAAISFCKVVEAEPSLLEENQQIVFHK